MITLTLSQLERLQQLMREIPKDVPKVTARAINRAADSAKTQASRSVRATYTIKNKDIARTIKIKKASAADLNADIRSKGPVEKLTNFKTTPSRPQPNRKKPVYVSVRKGSKKAINGSFLANSNGGHANVFTRVSKKRLPIRGHYGPSVPQMIGNEDTIRDVEAKASEVLETRLTHEIGQMMGGSS